MRPEPSSFSAKDTDEKDKRRAMEKKKERALASIVVFVKFVTHLGSS